MNSFEACEVLIQKHAPLLMVVGDDLPRTAICNRVPQTYRTPIHPNTKAKMNRLRSAGLTIGEVARKCRVGWRTVWQYTHPTLPPHTSPLVVATSTQAHNLETCHGAGEPL